MKVYKSKKVHPHGVWGSEIRLNSISIRRSGKVKKLLRLLEREGLDETVS